MASDEKNGKIVYGQVTVDCSADVVKCFCVKMVTQANSLMALWTSENV